MPKLSNIYVFQTKGNKTLRSLRFETEYNNAQLKAINVITTKKGIKRQQSNVKLFKANSIPTKIDKIVAENEQLVISFKTKSSTLTDALIKANVYNKQYGIPLIKAVYNPTIKLSINELNAKSSDNTNICDIEAHVHCDCPDYFWHIHERNFANKFDDVAFSKADYTRKSNAKYTSSDVYTKQFSICKHLYSAIITLSSYANSGDLFKVSKQYDTTEDFKYDIKELENINKLVNDNLAKALVGNNIEEFNNTVESQLENIIQVFDNTITPDSNFIKRLSTNLDKSFDEFERIKHTDDILKSKVKGNVLATDSIKRLDGELAYLEDFINSLSIATSGKQIDFNSMIKSIKDLSSHIEKTTLVKINSDINYEQYDNAIDNINAKIDKIINVINKNATDDTIIDEIIISEFKDLVSVKAKLTNLANNRSDKIKEVINVIKTEIDKLINFAKVEIVSNTDRADNRTTISSTAIRSLIDTLLKNVEVMAKEANSSETNSLDVETLREALKIISMLLRYDGKVIYDISKSNYLKSIAGITGNSSDTEVDKANFTISAIAKLLDDTHINSLYKIALQFANQRLKPDNRAKELYDDAKYIVDIIDNVYSAPAKTINLLSDTERDACTNKFKTALIALSAQDSRAATILTTLRISSALKTTMHNVLDTMINDIQYQNIPDSISDTDLVTKITELAKDNHIENSLNIIIHRINMSRLKIVQQTKTEDSEPEEYREVMKLKQFKFSKLLGRFIDIKARESQANVTKDMIYTRAKLADIMTLSDRQDNKEVIQAIRDICKDSIFEQLKLTDKLIAALFSSTYSSFIEDFIKSINGKYFTTYYEVLKSMYKVQMTNQCLFFSSDGSLKEAEFIDPKKVYTKLDIPSTIEYNDVKQILYISMSLSKRLDKTRAENLFSNIEEFNNLLLHNKGKFVDMMTVLDDISSNEVINEFFTKYNSSADKIKDITDKVKSELYDKIKAISNSFNRLIPFKNNELYVATTIKLISDKFEMLSKKLFFRPIYAIANEISYNLNVSNIKSIRSEAMNTIIRVLSSATTDDKMTDVECNTLIDTNIVFITVLSAFKQFNEVKKSKYLTLIRKSSTFSNLLKIADDRLQSITDIVSMIDKIKADKLIQFINLIFKLNTIKSVDELNSSYLAFLNVSLISVSLMKNLIREASKLVYMNIQDVHNTLFPDISYQNADVTISKIVELIRTLSSTSRSKFQDDIKSVSDDIYSITKKLYQDILNLKGIDDYNTATVTEIKKLSNACIEEILIKLIDTTKAEGDVKAYMANAISTVISKVNNLYSFISITNLSSYKEAKDNINEKYIKLLVSTNQNFILAIDCKELNHANELDKALKLNTQIYSNKVINSIAEILKPEMYTALRYSLADTGMNIKKIDTDKPVRFARLMYRIILNDESYNEVESGELSDSDLNTLKNKASKKLSKVRQNSNNILSFIDELDDTQYTKLYCQVIAEYTKNYSKDAENVFKTSGILKGVSTTLGRMLSDGLNQVLDLSDSVDDLWISKLLTILAIRGYVTGNANMLSVLGLSKPNKLVAREQLNAFANKAGADQEIHNIIGYLLANNTKYLGLTDLDETEQYKQLEKTWNSIINEVVKQQSDTIKEYKNINIIDLIIKLHNIAYTYSKKNINAVSIMNGDQIIINDMIPADYMSFVKLHNMIYTASDSKNMIKYYTNIISKYNEFLTAINLVEKNTIGQDILEKIQSAKYNTLTGEITYSKDNVEVKEKQTIKLATDLEQISKYVNEVMSAVKQNTSLEAIFESMKESCEKVYNWHQIINEILITDGNKTYGNNTTGSRIINAKRLLTAICKDNGGVFKVDYIAYLTAFNDHRTIVNDLQKFNLINNRLNIISVNDYNVEIVNIIKNLKLFQETEGIVTESSTLSIKYQWNDFSNAAKAKSHLIDVLSLISGKPASIDLLKMSVTDEMIQQYLDEWIIPKYTILKYCLMALSKSYTLITINDFIEKFNTDTLDILKIVVDNSSDSEFKKIVESIFSSEFKQPTDVIINKEFIIDLNSLSKVSKFKNAIIDYASKQNIVLSESTVSKYLKLLVEEGWDDGIEEESDEAVLDNLIDIEDATEFELPGVEAEEEPEKVEVIKNELTSSQLATLKVLATFVRHL